MQPQHIIHFWFEELTTKQHFVKENWGQKKIWVRFQLIAAFESGDLLKLLKQTLLNVSNYKTTA